MLRRKVGNNISFFYVLVAELIQFPNSESIQLMAEAAIDQHLQEIVCQIAESDVKSVRLSEALG